MSNTLYAVWRPEEAQQPVADIWEGLSEVRQHEYSKASHRLDRLLQETPESRGESRGGGVRILIELPAAVLFCVEEDARRVRVLRAWITPPQA